MVTPLIARGDQLLLVKHNLYHFHYIQDLTMIIYHLLDIQ